MKGLRFKVSEFRNEIEAQLRISSDFLAAHSTAQLRDLQVQVDGLMGRATNAETRLEIPRHAPLWTRPSAGAYEHAGEGQFQSLQASLSCLWTVKPVGQSRKKPGGDRTFEIFGVASTAIDFWVDTEELIEHQPESIAEDALGDTLTKVGSLRLEVGNRTDDGQASPGPLFHSQVPDSEKPDVAVSSWPHWLSVPRVHSMPFTPMLALEFTLSEVFQAEWQSHLTTSGQHSAMVNRWAEIQRNRMRKFLAWQEGTLDKMATPLLGLKHCAPHEDAFA